MSRPRKFVRVMDGPDGNLIHVKTGGREITDLSFHVKSGRYYTIDKSNQRTYLGKDITEAAADIDRKNPAIQQLFEDRMNTMVEVDKVMFDSPLETLQSALNHIVATQKPDRIPESVEKLSTSLKYWIYWMTDEGSKPRTDHIITTERYFNRFIKRVKDIPVSLLNKKTFVSWQMHIKGLKNITSKTRENHHQAVSRVLKLTKRKNDWKFPDGLYEWLDDWKFDKRIPYVPKDRNKEPMPVEVFHRLINVADQWALIDPEQFDVSTNRGRGKKTQAINKKRDGIQFAAMIKLGLHGLANIDCARIELQNLHLDEKLPYFDFPRTKCEHKTGYAIDRKTPLLPSCVKALKRWIEFDKPLSTVFRTNQKSAFDSAVITKVIKRMHNESKTNGWSFKHLRNIGGTVGDKAGMSEMKIDRFLGHTLKKERSKYLGSVGPEYLIDLVCLIGNNYVNGEKIG